MRDSNVLLLGTTFHRCWRGLINILQKFAGPIRDKPARGVSGA